MSPEQAGRLGAGLATRNRPPAELPLRPQSMAAPSGCLASRCQLFVGTLLMSSWSRVGTDLMTRPCSLARCSTQMKHRCTAGA